MNTLSVVHDVLRRQVQEGDFCIDATAGKGRDTALLCRLTGENGRLPGGDPTKFTTAETSLPAVDAGLKLLQKGGLMALALYYGKENGYEERDAILAHLRELDDRTYTVLGCEWMNRKNDPPLPIFIWKE